MSGVLFNRRLHNLAGKKSKQAVAAAAARHHGRSAPSSTAAASIVSIARNRSSPSLAGCPSGFGDSSSGNDATRNRCRRAVSTKSGGVSRDGEGYRAGGRESTTIAGVGGFEASRASVSSSCAAPSLSASATGGAGVKRGVSSIATSSSPSLASRSKSPAAAAAAAAAAAGGAGGLRQPPSTSGCAMLRTSSLLTPAASAYPSSSLLAPSAAAYTGVNGSGSRGASRVDAVVIGAGQAGLSVAYHLQKAGGLRVVALDANQEPGGAWRHRWPSLELFSTRKWSSLPGYPMFAHAACEDGYPTTGEMAMYMAEYESVMKLNVVRPVQVTGISRTPMGNFLVETDCLLGGTVARWEARTVISAAGTHAAPLWPRLPGSESFRGTQIHSSQYCSAEEFRGKRVAVVGAGNSGAQIMAEVSAPGVAASALWSTLGEPSFLPMGLSGKEIFDTVARLRQKQGFVRESDIPSLHSIIMQPGVIEAAERGSYDQRVPAFTRLTPTGVAWEASADGRVSSGHAEVDAIIWCTGYRANTSHLSRLGLVRPDSTVLMDGRDMGETVVPGVFAVGYGNWAGVGSGSIPGSTVYAKRAATAAVQYLRGGNLYDSSRIAVEATAAMNGTARLSSWPSASSASWPSSMSMRSNTATGRSAWPTDGGSSARAATATATMSGASMLPSVGTMSGPPPLPPVVDSTNPGGSSTTGVGQAEDKHEEELQVSVAA